MENFCLPTDQWSEGGLNRLEYFYPNGIMNIRTDRGQRFYNTFLKWQKKLHIKRKISGRNCIYGGSSWWSLSRECVSYVVDYTRKKPQLFRRLRFSYAPDEIYFQTVIMNSEFAKHVVNDHLRYIVWRYKNGNIPANLDLADLKPILLSDKIFARKFEPSFSLELLDKLQHLNTDYLSVGPTMEMPDKKCLLKQIADYLYTHGQECPFEGLYYGKAGIAVFLFHYAKFVSDEKYAEKGYELLTDLSEHIGNSTTLDYADGFLGIAAVFEYLYLHRFIEEDTNEILEEVDKKVLDWIQKVQDADALEMNNVYRLDIYLGFRLQNKDQVIFSEEIYQRWLGLVQCSILPVESVLSLEGSRNYSVLISLARGTGIRNGYAGIGFELLSELANDLDWRELNG